MAALKSLQQVHAPQEMDNAETVQLRQELKDREKEIETIRNKLDGLRQVGALDDTETTDNEQPRTRPLTPESNLGEPNDRATDTCSNSPSTPVASTLSRPLFAVRTQSGSFISAISKQPTPAPSTPGIDHDDPFAMIDDDILASHSRDVMKNSARMPLDEGGTPASTSATADRVAELLKEVEKYKLVATEAKRQADVSRDEVQNNVCLSSNLPIAFGIQEILDHGLTVVGNEA